MNMNENQNSPTGGLDGPPEQASCPFGFGKGKPTAPPRVRGLPLVGNTWAILRHPWDFLQACHRTYGSVYQVRILTQKAVVLTGPAVRELYSEAGDNFLERSFFYQRLKQELDANELIFCTKGKRHQEMRRSGSLAFSRHVAAQHLPDIAKEMNRCFSHLVAGQRYDVMQFTSEVLLAAAGPMIGACDLGPLIQAAHDYTTKVMQVAAGTATPLALWNPRYRRAKKACFEFGYDLLRKWRAGEIGRNSNDYLIGCLAEARDEQGQALADKDVVSLALLMLVGAGVYTNRIVSFMLYELFRDENLRQRVAAEVDAGFAHGVTYDALCEMKLLQAVFTETLRRYPIWFLVPFRAEKGFEFAGKRIRAGELVLLSSVQEHFLPEYYPDPNQFDPERCRAPRNEHQRRGAFAPFGSGNRRCIASGQVEIMSLLFVAMFLHRTRFRGDANYDLQVRLDPLPGAHQFYLQFEGLRPPLQPPTAAPQPPPSRVEKLDSASDRLVWEETEVFRSIVDREMEVRVFPADAEVFRQGDKPDAFYIIESGEVVVLQTGQTGGQEKLATLGPGDVFGEVGILRRQPRSATIKVAPGTDRLVALKCSAGAFERLLGELNIVGEELMALIRHRKIAASLARLAPALDRGRLGEFVHEADFRRGRRGEIFVREGDPADVLHVVQRGTFEVVIEIAPGTQRILARLGPGDFFGEMGLLRNAPRAATVRVAADCDDAETLLVGKEAFLKLIEPGSTFREKVYRDLALRTV